MRNEEWCSFASWKTTLIAVVFFLLLFSGPFAVVVILWLGFNHPWGQALGSLVMYVHDNSAAKYTVVGLLLACMVFGTCLCPFPHHITDTRSSSKIYKKKTH